MLDLNDTYCQYQNKNIDIHMIGNNIYYCSDKYSYYDIPTMKYRHIYIIQYYTQLYDQDIILLFEVIAVYKYSLTLKYS